MAKNKNTYRPGIGLGGLNDYKAPLNITMEKVSFDDADFEMINTSANNLKLPGMYSGLYIHFNDLTIYLDWDQLHKRVFNKKTKRL